MKRKDEQNSFKEIWLLLFSFVGFAVCVMTAWQITVSRIPDMVGRLLTEEERAEVISRNSSLTEYVYLTPNADFPREQNVCKITIHHMAGNLSLADLGASFAQRDRRASANYAIDGQGKVGLYVEEQNRAWTSSSAENDGQAITIEVANEEIGGDWRVSDAAYEQLIALCVDICKRNHIQQLVFTGDEKGNLTFHKMFSKRTECPGPYLESKMPDLVRRVNERLKELKI